MWKESYRVGVESIDAQHMELFRMADSLMRAIENGADRKTFQESIAFLKNYVVFHFKDEEAYQTSVHYAGIEGHKKEHRAFTRSVLDYERKLEDSDYDISVIKDLMGMLTSWLIYHVADTDQKMVRGETGSRAISSGQSQAGLFSSCLREVLAKMAGLALDQMKESPGGSEAEPDIYIRLALVGEKQGSAVFGFSRELAFRLIESMTFMKVNELDELVCSALSELVNITGGNAATALADSGILCDIRPPEILERPDTEGMERILLDTGAGHATVLARLQ